MGPGFSEHFARGLLTIGILLFVGGILIGTGCNRGCQYVFRHLSVEWKP